MPGCAGSRPTRSHAMARPLPPAATSPACGRAGWCGPSATADARASGRASAAAGACAPASGRATRNASATRCRSLPGGVHRRRGSGACCCSAATARRSARPRKARRGRRTRGSRGRPRPSAAHRTWHGTTSRRHRMPAPANRATTGRLPAARRPRCRVRRCRTTRPRLGASTSTPPAPCAADLTHAGCGRSWRTPRFRSGRCRPPRCGSR